MCLGLRQSSITNIDTHKPAHVHVESGDGIAQPDCIPWQAELNPASIRGADHQAGGSTSLTP